MRITHLRLDNWRNFKRVDVDLQSRLFIFGPNASGKSNLLDAIRFLRDLTVDGGGLQQTVGARGGVSRVRNLAARNHNKGRVTVAVAIGDDARPRRWEYELTFTAEQGGKRRPVVFSEVVRSDETPGPVLERPLADDNADPERRTQTALEQVVANREFREVAEFLASARYLHLVPQVIRDPERAGGGGEDPFGGDFLLRVARSPQRERNRRLRLINQALRRAVPQLENLELVSDDDGQPHLQARYTHWRTAGARQTEMDFSDGTLRLIGLLWALQDRGRSGAGGPILLEEPELSLHADIVRQLPTLTHKATKAAGRQLMATSHALDLLRDQGLGLDEVLILKPSGEGTTAQLASEMPDVVRYIDGGLTLDEALLGDLKPAEIDQLSLLAFR